MNLAATILSVVGTLVAAVAAIGAWMAARRSGQAAAALTLIEQRRLHADVTPVFEVSCQVKGGDRAELRIAFVGPAGLDRLDQVTVTIRDDIRGRKPVIAGGPTTEEIAAQVWGPYRFVPGVDGADEAGRGVAPISLMLGDWAALLARTNPPTNLVKRRCWMATAAHQPTSPTHDDLPARGRRPVGRSVGGQDR